MEIISKIFNWIKGIPFYIWIIVITLGIGCYFIYKDYKRSSSYVPVVVHLKDSVYENKKGELYKAELAAILSAKDLKKQYDNLYEEYKKIKDAKPLVITQTIIETKIDSVYIPTTISQSDSGYHFKWDYRKEFDKNNYVSIEGETKADSILREATTLIKSLRIGSDLTLDLITNSDYPSTLEIITRSNNPYLNIIKTEGAVIDPLKNPAIKKLIKKNEDKWSVGFIGGFGAMYGIDDKGLHYGPYIGIGVTKKLFSF